MSTPDGITSPHSAALSNSPPTTSTSSTKRKRRNSNENTTTNAIDPARETNGTDRQKNDVQELLSNIFEVLKRQDTKPSILHHEVSPHRASSGEPPAKRTKLSQSPPSQDTIAAKVERKEYTSVDEFANDVDTVTSELLAPIKSKEHIASDALHTRHLPASAEDNEFLSRVFTFKKTLKTLLLPECKSVKAKAVNSLTNGVDYRLQKREGTKDTGSDSPERGLLGGDDIVSKSVLTLFGNAQGPKQLFSSLQKPIGAKGPAAPGSIAGAVIPLRESALPNGISTTKIIPTKPDALSDAKTKRTFGSVFAPPANLPQLLPPKPSRNTTTRGSTVGWTESEQFFKSMRKGGYATQNLPTGQWLGYDGVPLLVEPSTPEAKRKQRTRALSTGEAEPRLSDEAVAAVEHAKAEALFRRAYSSFAPSHDDSGAVVPREIKNRVWWYKIGRKRFQETLAIDPALIEDEVPVADQGTLTDSVDEEQLFREAVENYVSEPDDAEDLPFSQEHPETVEQKLEEISDLLETLRSYQRIRNATLTTNPRNALSNSLPPSAGTPSNPSQEETAVYINIRNRLVSLICTLPPYAVAKLNGDRNADLIVSRKIMIESSDHHGVMEADQAGRLAKAAATSIASNIVVTRGSSNVTGSQYGAKATPMAQSLPKSSTQPQGYFPQRQPPARSPSWTTGRAQPANPQAYQTSRATPAPRPSYPLQNARPQSSSHSQPTSQYYQQRPVPNGFGQTTPYSQTTPYTQPTSRSYQQPTQPAYQQRAQTTMQTPSYSSTLQTPTNPNPYGRAPSPQKPAPQHNSRQYYQPQQSQRPQLYSVPTGGQAQAPQRPLYPQQNSGIASYSPNQANGSFAALPTNSTMLGTAPYSSAQVNGSYTAPAPPINSSSGSAGQWGPSGYNAGTSMDGQRSVSRQGTVTPQPQPYAAQYAVQGKGTPQPPYGGQAYGGQVNGTPSVTA